MADPQSVAFESPLSSNIGLAHGAPPKPQPARQDTSSSDVSDRYSPLPPGCWTLDFHGNCPRCHHHHSAVQVKVKVTQDASQVSYVHCEECKEKWAAFGGRNTTMISLLSTTTNEPDPIEKGVRLSLIDVVKMATDAASLGTLPEHSSRVPSRQSLVRSPASEDGRTSPASSKPSTAAGHAETLPSAQSGQYQQQPESIAPSVVDYAITTKYGSGPRRMLSKLKKRIASHFPKLHRENVKRLVVSFKQTKMSTRQFEKSPVRTPPASDQHINVSAEQSPVVQVQDDFVHSQAARPEGSEIDVAGPSKQIREVVAFIASLDKSVLASKSEQERAEWMREVYTDFKARNKRHGASAGISTIVHTGIQCDLPRSLSGPLNRRSAEVLGAGTHIEGLESIDSPRRSISISDVNSDIQSASEDNTAASFLRNSRQEIMQQVRRGRGSQRPQSLPSPPRLQPQLRRRVRNSFDALMYSETGSTSSMAGQASSRWSQGSTLRGSPSFQGSVSQETLRHHVSDEGHDRDDPDSRPPPSSTPRADAD